MEKEIEYLVNALANSGRPFCVILGGKKVSNEIQVIRNMLDKANFIFIGGAMAFPFLKAKGHSVGLSKYESKAKRKDGTEVDIVKLADGLLREAELKAHGKILLPVDFFTRRELEDPERPAISEYRDIPDNQMALDIGPKTLRWYLQEIKLARTVLWNGPLGVFEHPAFSQGTFSIAEGLAKYDCLSIVGSGDTATAVRQAGVADGITHISTGGGAMLELLEGKELPEMVVLTDK